MQQRYYDPIAGRFLSLDPVVTNANTGKGFGRYAYVDNQPYKYIDPDGRDKQQERAARNARAMQAVVKAVVSMLKGAKNAEEKTPSKETSNAARKEAMRMEKIPTSQQPVSQSKNESGHEYTYEVPKAGGGTELKSVQQQTMDVSHQGQEHWEAGKVKIDPLTGEVRMTKHDRPKLENDKSKVDVKSDNGDKRERDEKN